MSTEASSPWRGFPTTRWSRIVEDPEATRETRKALWESLAAAYWKPVYAYVRMRWARSDEDARDCTQEFFLWMMEGDFLSHADPGRGRFRGLVKATLDNFVRDLERKRRTLKRGGEKTIVSLQADGEDGPPLDLPDPGERSPGDVLDDVWRAQLLESANAALEEELRGHGKAVCFEIFRDYYLCEAELDYAAVAKRHGVTTSDVSNYLQFAKRRYRVLLRHAVADTVESQSDLEDELRWLLGDAGR